MARLIRVPRLPIAPRPRRPVSTVPPPVTRTIADLTRTAEPVPTPEKLSLDVIAEQIKNLDLVQGPLIGTEDAIVVRNGKAVRASTKQIAEAGTVHDGGGRGQGRRAFIRNLEGITEAQAEAIVTLGADAISVDAGGIQFTFDTSNVDADPGAGDIRFDNSTPALTTLLYADNLDRFGASSTAWLDALDDGGSSGGRGRIRISERGEESNYAEYNVTGSVADGTGYRKVTVAYIAGPLVPTAGMALVVTFNPAASGYPLPLDTTLAALVAIGNAINTTNKTKHKLVSDEVDRVWRALGSAAESSWRPLDDQSGASDITPA